MTIRASAVLLFCAALSALAARTATGVWVSKTFANWTEKDARAVINHSPWAREMPLPINGRPDVMVVQPGSNVSSPPTASLGNPANSTTGGNMSVAGAGDQGPAEPGGTRLPVAPTPSGITPSSGAPNPQPVLTVIWASATPVRLAVLKLRSHGEPVPDAEVARAKAPRDHYVVAVVGLPAPQNGADPKTLASRAFLSIKGHAPLKAFESDYRRIGNSDVYFFRFNRTSLPITTSDGHVEFRLTFGSMEIKQRFDLNDMKYDGQLAL